MAESQNIIYDWISAEDLDQAIQIEEQGYPADEAASLEAFKYRQSAAASLFLGAYLPHRELIGYICSTLSPSQRLTHASMTTHVSGSSSVCIHSVCVHPSHRRRGVGLALLNEYIARLRLQSESGSGYERILLIIHKTLRPFYEQAGFENIGLSPVTHGALPWYEMRLLLAQLHSAEPDQPKQQAPPPGLYEALANASRRPRPTVKLLRQYQGGIRELRVEDPDKEGAWVNSADLLCPRPECGSFVLMKGKAEWKVRASVDMEPQHMSTTPSPHLPKLPAPPETTDWWLVGPTPMEFENIGFSRAVQGLVGENGRPLKLLACAECDLGPIGWAEDGGKEFWVACERVGYRE
ncbi:hypothetical protein C0991_008100 [Blastosporella zonata]|nr:hypothetical protein C0991_008100 [Blastosporella zonata]